MSATEMPTELVALQRSDVLILNNVPADAFSAGQQRHIENYVRDLGHGLVVIVGSIAYGPEGYHRKRRWNGHSRHKCAHVNSRMLSAIECVHVTSGSMANYDPDCEQKIQLAIEGVRTDIRNAWTKKICDDILGYGTTTMSNFAFLTSFLTRIR